MLPHDIDYEPCTHVFEESILRPHRLTHEDVGGAKIVENINEIATTIEKILKECGYTCSHIAQAIKSRNISE